MARSLEPKGPSSRKASPSPRKPSPSPQRQASSASKSKSKPKAAKHKDDYRSEGVEDNDVLLLPVSDYQVMGLMTLVGTIVRLFRIYQPTSVVFDEVQYVFPQRLVLW